MEIKGKSYIIKKKYIKMLFILYNVCLECIHKNKNYLCERKFYKTRYNAYKWCSSYKQKHSRVIVTDVPVTLKIAEKGCRWFVYTYTCVLMLTRTY